MLKYADSITRFHQQNLIFLKWMMTTLDMATPIKKMMIVDDEPLFQDLMQDIFCNMGIGVTSAYSGHEALQEAEHDLYLLDIGMPGLDGISTLFELRKKFGHDVPAILITGYDIAGIENIKSEYNISAILQKPFNLDLLKQLINQHFAADAPMNV